VRPAAAKLRAWKRDPTLFVRECLGAEPDAWQVEVLEACMRNQRICLKASKGPGKSTVMAWMGWHFLATNLHPKVVATSISGDNLRDGLWTEFAKWQARSPFLMAAFEWSAERIVCKDHPETWWASARQWSKSADPSQQANTLAGIHAENILFLVDEAGGVPDGVVAAAEAALATGQRAVLVISGNPTHLSGPLYRACTRERALWWVKEISGDPEDPQRAPRVSKDWAREQIEKFGRDNPWVLVNVFGQFPPASSNALLGVEEVEASAKRALVDAEWVHAPKVMGVDVARFGDDRSVLQPRQGRAAMVPKVFRNLDTMQLAGQVALAIESWRPDAVFVDVDGVGGGVVDRLTDLGHDVIGIHFGSRPLRAQPKMANRRAEMWWQMAEWVRDGGCIPNDAELMAELTAPTYRFDSKGSVQLEPKEDLKKRGLPSPDKADALALTFAAPVVARRPAGATWADRTDLRTRQDFDPFAEGRA
jgi:phage terminase large subunit